MGSGPRGEMETGIKKRRLSTNPWFVAGIGSLIYGFGRGIHTSFGVIYVALLETFSWNRGITAGIYSLNLIVDAIASPIVGHLIDRYGPEKIVGLGCLLLATGLLLSSRISSLWDFYIYFGLISALGFSFMGMVPHVVLVSQWFSTRRAVAIGIVFSATGIGMMLWGPAIQGLISTWDLSWALRALGIFALIFVMPLALIFYRRGPFYEAQHRGPSDLQSQWTARLALRSIQFWSLFLARVLASSGVLVILTHQVAHVVDIGYSRIFAATVFGMMGIMSTFGRILFGYVADLFSKPSRLHAEYGHISCWCFRIDGRPGPDPTLASVSLPVLLWHGIRIQGGDLLRPFSGYILRQGLRRHIRILRRQRRSGGSLGFIPGRRPARHHRQLFYFISILRRCPVPLRLMYMAAVVGMGSIFRPEASTKGRCVGKIIEGSNPSCLGVGHFSVEGVPVNET